MNIKTINFKSIIQLNKYHGFILKETNYGKLNFPRIKYTEGLNYISQLQPAELQHSLILGSILDPNGKHGCGSLFLREFIKYVYPGDEFIFDENEKWHVSVELERFDIRIKNENNTKIIILENKSNWASDQPNQLYRYWLYGIYNIQKGIPKILRPISRILYLSPTYEKQYEEQSITRPNNDNTLPLKVPEGIIKIITFKKEIVEWLENCMNLVEEKSEIYYYLKQYKDYWGYALWQTL